MSSIRSSEAAFTLAEVLITITVVGIVAAITLPILVQSYKKHVVETRLSKFYSTINQALNLSEIDNGDRHTWDTLGSFCEAKVNSDGSKTCVSGTEEAVIWYNKYLAKYLKVIKVESGVDITYDVEIKELHPTDVILYFPDGSALQFSGRGWNYYIYAKDMIKNGRPEHWGVTAFPFRFDDNLRLVPFYSVERKIPCSEAYSAYCTNAIAENGWKIPKDYPFKF